MYVLVLFICAVASNDIDISCEISVDNRLLFQYQKDIDVGDKATQQTQRWYLDCIWNKSPIDVCI